MRRHSREWRENCIVHHGPEMTAAIHWHDAGGTNSPGEGETLRTMGRILMSEGGIPAAPIITILLMFG